MNEQQQEHKKVIEPTTAAVVTGPGFETLSLRPELLRSLREIGFKNMFPIQASSIPPLKDGKDVIGQAHTGSGKTAAYALPILQRIDGSKRYLQALVVVPTRELALQVTDEFNRLARYLDVKAFSIYGGQAITPQIERLRKKTPQVVVATPGRLIDHIDRGTIDLQDVQTVILDEADRMLDMGFIDDVDFIMKQLPSGSQTALFSATMPKEIVHLSRKYMDHPVEVLIDSDEPSLEDIEQKFAMVDERSKFAALAEYIRKNGISSGIIFCSTKIKTQRIAERLQAAGFKAAPIHGDLSQNQREHAMRNFRSGYVELLIATDVAARGIDVPAVSHVINYDVPLDPLTYFHRIGRTARAGRTGKAMTLVSNSEYPDFSRISAMTEVAIKKITDILPEGYRPPPPSPRDQERRQYHGNSRGGSRYGGDRFQRREGGDNSQQQQHRSGGQFSFTENVAASHSSGNFQPHRGGYGGNRPQQSNYSRGGREESQRPAGDRFQNSRPQQSHSSFRRPRRQQQHS